MLEAVATSNLGHLVNILFVGDGYLKNELETQSKRLGLNNVAFLGFLNQIEMPLAYALGDCLCLLSDTPAETWGLVVNEAMACGRPVIVSDACGCVPDLIEDKQTGWVTPSGNLKSTTEKLKTAVSQFDNWSKIGNQGREVVSKHSFDSMANGIVSALEEAGSNR